MLAEEGGQRVVKECKGRPVVALRSKPGQKPRGQRAQESGYGSSIGKPDEISSSARMCATFPDVVGAGAG